MTLDEAVAALRSLTPAASGGHVRCDIADGVAHVRLDNPDARSAVTFRMMVQLGEIVQSLQRFEGAAVIVSSTDPAAFCAGGHLGELLGTLDAPERAAAMCDAMSTLLDALRDLPAPTLAVVHAVAVGGGAELATAADWRIFGPTATVRFVHTRLGVVPGWGGASRLERQVGRATALRWLAFGEVIDAETALAAGFADVVVADPLDEAFTWARRMRDRSEAIRAAKAQLLSGGSGAGPFSALWGGPVHRAALAARGR